MSSGRAVPVSGATASSPGVSTGAGESGLVVSRLSPALGGATSAVPSPAGATGVVVSDGADAPEDVSPDVPEPDVSLDDVESELAGTEESVPVGLVFEVSLDVVPVDWPEVVAPGVVGKFDESFSAAVPAATACPSATARWLISSRRA